MSSGDFLCLAGRAGWRVAPNPLSSRKARPLRQSRIGGIAWRTGCLLGWAGHWCTYLVSRLLFNVDILEFLDNKDWIRNLLYFLLNTRTRRLLTFGRIYIRDQKVSSDWWSVMKWDDRPVAWWGVIKWQSLTTLDIALVYLVSLQLTKFQSSWEAPILAERFMLSLRYTTL